MDEDGLRGWTTGAQCAASREGVQVVVRRKFSRTRFANEREIIWVCGAWCSARERWSERLVWKLPPWGGPFRFRPLASQETDAAARKATGPHAMASDHQHQPSPPSFRLQQQPAQHGNTHTQRPWPRIYHSDDPRHHRQQGSFLPSILPCRRGLIPSPVTPTMPDFSLRESSNEQNTMTFHFFTLTSPRALRASTLPS